MLRKIPKPLILVVLDGWGVAPPGPYNAVHVGHTPVLDRLQKSYPYVTLTAHGRAVGLPEGQMGNSEVGHLNLGAGRIVKQELVLINEAIENGSFKNHEVFWDAARKVKNAGGKMHIMGLCSPGGVHSSLDHLYALVDLFSEKGLEVRIHAITDGRDTPPSSARGFLADIERQIEGKAEISVVVGRFYSMDRDKRWERVERGYLAHVSGEGTPHRSVDEAVAAAYEADESDEFITPRIIIDAEGNPKGSLKDNDGVIFFNFRADRAREMTLALINDAFDGFARKARPRLSACVCMTEYRSDFNLPVAFPPISMDNVLGKVLSGLGLKQFRAAETEKYAHVTFFFNDGMEQPFEGEDRTLIPSPKEVPTYDKKPEMSAEAVTDAVVECVSKGGHDFILVNFANGDMVGHTGILEAAVKAAEIVDQQVSRIVDAVTAAGGSLIITADHGNLEKMLDEETGERHTAHTNNPVPLILVDEGRKGTRLPQGGALCDVAPTVLVLLDIPKPFEMTGKSLIEPA